jgi:hypothetical protein
VVANESYEDFARALQTEYEEDCGITFGKVPVGAFANWKCLLMTSRNNSAEMLLPKYGHRWSMAAFLHRTAKYSHLLTRKKKAMRSRYRRT